MAMWQRFTDRAKRVVVLAQEEAQKAGAAEVAPEHLLLGLIEEAGCARPGKSFRTLLESLGEARRQKEEAVIGQAYEETARWRDRERHLEEQLAQATQGPPVEVTEEDLRDVVRLWGGGNGQEG